MLHSKKTDHAEKFNTIMLINENLRSELMKAKIKCEYLEREIRKYREEISNAQKELQIQKLSTEELGSKNFLNIILSSLIDHEM